MKHEKIANNSGAQLTADSSYQGLSNLHANSVLSKKSTKNHPVSKQGREQNRTKISQ